MSKHTQGDWKAVRGALRPEVWSQDGSECITDRVFNQNEDIIAAAPSMYRALNQLIAEWERGPQWVSEDTIDSAVRATLKAEGLNVPGVESVPA